MFQNHLVKTVGDTDPDYFGKTQQPHGMEQERDKEGRLYPLSPARESWAVEDKSLGFSGSQGWAGQGMLTASSGLPQVLS